MPVEINSAAPFLQWFLPAAMYWLIVAGVASVIALAVCWVLAILRGGPIQGTVATGKVLAELPADLLGMSPRRVFALAWLAVKESIRRRVIVVFALFVLILLFAGWFLDPASRDPARLYLDVVLTFTGYLTLLFAFFLSALSLPADIKNHTLHTIVTKPVRSSEIVLARIVGFTVVGTVLLALMGAISYGFVVRGLSHTHRLTAADLQPAAGGKLLKGFTSQSLRHQHAVTIDRSTGKAWVEPLQGHTHALSVEGSGKTAVYTLGPPKDMLLARVPKYGTLRFKDRGGKDMEKGVNVGDEWNYRSFIEGGTNAAAIWTFAGLRQADFPEALFPKGLPLELTIEVFRTYKGDLTKGIPGSLSVRNPRTGKTCEVRIFAAKKFATDVQYIPRTLAGKKGEKIDLFRDMVDDGKLEVWLRCLDRAQYFGAAQADVYFRARDASFEVNFAKGYLGIWLQMVLVIGLGVMFSTFLSGPVALIATVGVAAAGLFRDFIVELASGKMLGGGPMEALNRIATQQNLISEMEPGLRTNVEKTADWVIEKFLGGLVSLLPDFGRFSFADYVSYGFNIPCSLAGGDDLLWQSVVRALGFLLPVFVAGYLFLKTREVAK